jgi:hypothetical protein
LGREYFGQCHLGKKYEKGQIRENDRRKRKRWRDKCKMESKKVN